MSSPDMPSNVMLVPMVVSKEVYAFLTRVGAKKGKRTETLLAECFKEVLEKLAKDEEGEET